ncbi:long-chain fatty acid transport protein 2-like [Aplochiton taeniatus]
MFGFRKKKPYYSILDRFLYLVRHQPHKPFIIFENEVYTYLDVDKQSNKVARALREHARLHEEDTVALFLGNEPSFVWIWLGIAKLSCAAAMLNSNLRSKSLLHCFSCCGAKVLIATPGDTGLLVSKITTVAPFLGYVRDPEQTEKKILRNVFRRGDEYFNAGDLLRIDHDGFIYFQDRMGDTFRWKGENVATAEVADILCMMTFIDEACVYGVSTLEVKVDFATKVVICCAFLHNL